MNLLTQAQRELLAQNGRRQAAVKGTPDEIDFVPVVKLFNPCGAATWLLTETEPDDPDIAWGLCDLSIGCAEFGTVRISALESVEAAPGFGIARDVYFRPDRPISAYGAEAIRRGLFLRGQAAREVLARGGVPWRAPRR